MYKDCMVPVIPYNSYFIISSNSEWSSGKFQQSHIKWTGTKHQRVTIAIEKFEFKFDNSLE